MSEQQQDGDGALGAAPITEGDDPVLSGKANEALDRLRAVVDQASQTVRELSEASRQWSATTQERASGMARGLRGQGERAVGTVSHQVEHYALASIAVAMGIGFLAGVLTRR